MRNKQALAAEGSSLTLRSGWRSWAARCVYAYHQTARRAQQLAICYRNVKTSSKIAISSWKIQLKTSIPSLLQGQSHCARVRAQSIEPTRIHATTPNYASISDYIQARPYPFRPEGLSAARGGLGRGRAALAQVSDGGVQLAADGAEDRAHGILEDAKGALHHRLTDRVVTAGADQQG